MRPLLKGRAVTMTSAPIEPSQIATRPLLSSLLRLAGPVALARLGVMGMGVADVVMVGHLAPQELAYLALGWSPTAVLMLAGIGLLTGVQVLSARAIGQNRAQDSGAVLRLGLVLSALAGGISVVALWLGAEPLLRAFGIERDLAHAAATVAGVLGLSLPLHLAFIAGSFFLEGIKRPNAATVIMWLANGINIAFNFWLIPHLGAVGSGWATVGSRVFLAVAVIGWIAFMPGARQFCLFRRPEPTAPTMQDVLRIGGAAALSQAAEAGAFTGMTIIAARISSDTVAAYQIMLNAMAVVFMIALGFSSATAVLTAEALGREDAGRARRASWMGVWANSAAMAIFGLVFLLFPFTIAKAYTSDLSVVALCVAAMPIAALALLPDGAQSVLSQALRARHDNWFPTASHVLAYVLIMPPLGWLLAERMGLGVTGLAHAILWASVVSAGVLSWRLIQLVRDIT